MSEMNSLANPLWSGEVGDPPLPCTYSLPDDWWKNPAYQWGVDWFRIHLDHWKKFLIPWRQSRPSVRILEIGCYEAASTCWLLAHLCTGDNDRIHTVDFWDGLNGQSWIAIHDRAVHNINVDSGKWKSSIYVSRSGDILPKLDKNSYDLIYIDGDHHADAVYQDSVKSWPLLKSGGLLLWDDWYSPCLEEREGVRKGLTRFFAEMGLPFCRFGYTVFAHKP